MLEARLQRLEIAVQKIIDILENLAEQDERLAAFISSEE